MPVYRLTRPHATHCAIHQFQRLTRLEFSIDFVTEMISIRTVVFTYLKKDNLCTKVLDAFPDEEGGLAYLIANSLYTTTESNYEKISCQTFDTPCIKFSDKNEPQANECTYFEVSLVPIS